MSNFYKALELPLIPTDLIPDLETLALGNVAPQWSNKPRSATLGNQHIDQDHYDRFDISVELQTWVDQNITNEYCNIGLSYMHSGPINLPHTDFTRDATMLYLFDTGGDNVETKFWRKKDDPIHHSNGLTPTTYNDLELLDSVVLKSNCWNILDALCLHSVEGKTRPRISLQLGFRRDSRWATHIFGDNYTG